MAISIVEKPYLSFFPACFFSSLLCLFCKYLNLVLTAEAESIHRVCCRFAGEPVLSQHVLRRLGPGQARWRCRATGARAAVAELGKKD